MISEIRNLLALNILAFLSSIKTHIKLSSSQILNRTKLVISAKFY